MVSGHGRILVFAFRCEISGGRQAKKVADHFYTGIPYEMCLRNYEFAHCLTVRVYAMRKSDFVYIEKPPVFTGGLACELTGVRVLRQDEEIIR